MHWLDVVILSLLGLGAALGFWSGLIMQIARLVSLGLSIYLTFLLHEPVTQLLHTRVAPEANVSLLRAIAYIGIFLAVYVTLFAVSRLLYKVVRATKLEFLDRLAGAALGAVKMLLIVAPASALLAYLALPATEEWMRDSAIAPALARGVDRALEMVPEHYRTEAHDSFEQVRQRVGADRAVDLRKIEEALRR
jgi:membrane protein required for colicin V production